MAVKIYKTTTGYLVVGTPDEVGEIQAWLRVNLDGHQYHTGIPAGYSAQEWMISINFLEDRDAEVRFKLSW